MAISGKVGNVYSSALLIENCEDVWTTGGAGRAVDTTTGKVGTYAARVTTTTIGATTLLQYKVISSANLTTYDGVYFWARSNLAAGVGSGALQLQLDDTNTCLSPLENLELPALTVNTWRQCFNKFTNPADLTAILAVGLYQVTDLDDGTFDVDDVQALKEIDGIKSWSLDYSSDTLDATDFDDAGIRAHIIGQSGWSGSFEGYKDTTPLGIGAEVYLVLSESSAISSFRDWIGKAIITACHPSATHEGIVSYSYDFQGTGSLESPSA